MATASTSTHSPELLASLEKHNATFTTLLSLIPSKFYVAPDPEEVSNWYWSCLAEGMAQKGVARK